jgi:hypothetical protein
VVYGCEGDLCSNLMVKNLEHVTVKALGIVDRDLWWDIVTTDNVLPKEFFDSCGGYAGEILNRHNGEGIIALC